MCCEGPTDFELPPRVAEMIAEYHRLLRSGYHWGGGAEVTVGLLRHVRFVPLERLLAEARLRLPDDQNRPGAEDAIWLQDFDDVLRTCLAGNVPRDLTVLHASSAGVRFETGPLPVVITGGAVEGSLLIDSSLERPLELRVGGTSLTVGEKEARLLPFSASPDDPVLTVEVDGEGFKFGPVATTAQRSRLRLLSPRPCRWSVTDAGGGSWFPTGCLEKWDYQHRPFFHAAAVELDVPAEVELEIGATRGIEYRTARAQVTLAPGSVSVVELEPERRLDPASKGWYGGDLHVHMNYSGDLVCEPSQAAMMQLGEGLHLMNLVAANASGTRVFDRESLEEWAGHDLPWSSGAAVARMGVEYRNDLLGHVHALGVSRPPAIYHTGHRGSDHGEDWPPNSTACRDLRAAGATLGYCHPVMSPITENDISPFFERPRSVEARELVVDAALGLVDSVDVLSNGAASATGSALLYRRLLGAGHRLAVTAGTDVFLSFSSSSTFSNPPGFARVYANVEGPLSVESFKTAVRRGQTIATNGPWLELDVEGHGPGATVDPGGDRHVRATARVEGPGADRLVLLTPDGPLAEVPVSGEDAVVSAPLPTAHPTFVVAVATGAPHPEVIDRHPYAHTSPVWVHLPGQRVLRLADVQWCLDWIRQLERLVRRHGVFHSSCHLDDVLAEMERATRYYQEALLAARWWDRS